jgi:hypothetical protein
MTSPGYSFEVALNYSDPRVPRYNLRDVVLVARRACPCIFGHPAGVLISGPDAIAFLNAESIQLPSLIKMMEYHFFFFCSIPDKSLECILLVLFSDAFMFPGQPVPDASDAGPETLLPFFALIGLALFKPLA